MFADLYVSYPIDSPFTYRVPQGMAVSAGMRVRVDFAGRAVTGFVSGVHDNEPSGFEVKDILSVIDEEPLFDSRLVSLARYVADTYLAAPGEVLSMALPSGNAPSARHRTPAPPAAPGFRLNDEQDLALRGIMDDEKLAAHLIFGVTGSGKTEVYIEAAREILARNQSVIYLVPEISLSSQIYSRLNRVFGDDLVLYHSHLTANQRLYNWMRFYSGDARVAVGTRSCVFLQCPDLGLIVIDEEHDGSYKEHSSPRYNARRVAFYRSRQEGARLVLGSATPSVESLYAAEKGVIGLHRLTMRHGGASLPSVEIVRVFQEKSSDIISSRLRLLARREVDRGKQAVFLLNRRGFSPVLLCGACGSPVKCPNCNISLSCHRGGVMLCHYCGYRAAEPGSCAECGSADLKKIGSGTQRVEDIIGEVFHTMRVFRLDQDSSRKKGAVGDLIEKMNRGEIDILLGTQMVAKGFDFPNVTLVGVLMADIGMQLPDFRASERIFALMMQVAGRSGRGADSGRVVIQTMNESSRFFEFLKRQDYYGFYRWELEMRRALEYPPFARMARVLARGKDEARVAKAIGAFGDSLKSAIEAGAGGIRVLGPSAAPLSKIGGNYRHHLIMKSRDSEGMRRAIDSARREVSFKDVYFEIDIDPYDIL